jgi:hypothetical protein
MPDTSAQFQPNLEFVKRFFIKVPSTKFDGNSSSWSHAITCRHLKRQMVTKLTGTLHDYVNMPKNIKLSFCWLFLMGVKLGLSKNGIFREAQKQG